MATIKNKKQEIPNMGKNILNAATVETTEVVAQKLKAYLPYNPATLSLGKYV